MKKTLFLATILFSASTIAADLEHTTFKNVDDIEIIFNEKIATLKTPCYNVVGAYNIEKKDENKLKIDFEFNRYENTRECSDFDAKQSRIAFDTLLLNESMVFTIQDNLNIKVNMNSFNQNMMTYKVKS